MRPRKEASQPQRKNVAAVHAGFSSMKHTMVRLQKVIAASGLASRRAAETMIQEGKVTVNGEVVQTPGRCIDPSTDHVKVNGRHLKPTEPEVFLLLHKPPGYVTTMHDPLGRSTIAELLEKVKVRVFPVGRLDYDAEGLILLTNNGNLAQACLHPRYHVPKTYLVKVSGVCTDEEIRNLEEGVALEDGVTAPAVVRKSGKAKSNSWLELTIYEGRKHQIKRMIEAVGHRVMRIKRTRFGPIALGDLPVGACRFAADAEANALRAIVQQKATSGRVGASPSTVSLRSRKTSGNTGRPTQGWKPGRASGTDTGAQRDLRGSNHARRSRRVGKARSRPGKGRSLR